MNQSQSALQDYKVLDFTQHVAGPMAGRLLATLGAEVIKLEWAPMGDFTRTVCHYKDRRSSYFVQNNSSKKSLCLDPKSAAGREIIYGLIPKMDVFLENTKPGTMAKLGLDYETLKKLNPRLVMCSISAFGQSGPLAGKPGYDIMGAAIAGMIDMQGEPDQAPVLPGGNFGDVNTGISAVASIACALLQRSRTGVGQYLDICLLNTYFHSHDQSVHMYSASDHRKVPHRSGRHHFMLCPAGIFKARERYVVIGAGTPGQFESMCKAMGRPELIKDPRFATFDARLANQKQLIELIEQWLQSQPSDKEAISRLEEADVPIAPVLSLKEAIDHPHLRQRGTIVDIPDPIYGALAVPASPLRLSASPPINTRAPLLGEHNEEILRQYLGYSDQKIAELKAESIIRAGDR